MKKLTKDQPSSNVPDSTIDQTNNITPLDSPGYLAVNKSHRHSNRIAKFLNLFQCIATKTLDDTKKYSYYAPSLREPNLIELEKTLKQNGETSDQR